MIDWTSLLLLAQDAAPDAAPPVQPPSMFPAILIYMVPVIVVWYVLAIRPQNKERAKRQEMLNSLKKNDPVITIGGIFGTVSHISEDGKEVTLKVDDNARIKLRRDAISEVVSKDKSDTA